MLSTAMTEAGLTYVAMASVPAPRLDTRCKGSCDHRLYLSNEGLTPMHVSGRDVLVDGAPVAEGWRGIGGSSGNCQSDPDVLGPGSQVDLARFFTIGGMKSELAGRVSYRVTYNLLPPADPDAGALSRWFRQAVDAPRVVELRVPRPSRTL